MISLKFLQTVRKIFKRLASPCKLPLCIFCPWTQSDPTYMTTTSIALRQIFLTKHISSLPPALFEISLNSLLFITFEQIISVQFFPIQHIYVWTLQRFLEYVSETKHMLLLFFVFHYCNNSHKQRSANNERDFRHPLKVNHREYPFLGDLQIYMQTENVYERRNILFKNSQSKKC